MKVDNVDQENQRMRQSNSSQKNDSSSPKGRFADSTHKDRGNADDTRRKDFSKNSQPDSDKRQRGTEET